MNIENQMEECKKNLFDSISTLCNEKKHIYIMYKCIYDRCIIQEKDKEKCKDIYNIVESSKQDYEQWKIYEEKQIKKCDLLKKYM